MSFRVCRTSLQLFDDLSGEGLTAVCGAFRETTNKENQRAVREERSHNDLQGLALMCKTYQQKRGILSWVIIRVSGFCHFGLVSFEPWHSRHVHVSVRFRVCSVRSLVCVPCFMLERGVWVPPLMSWVSVSRSTFCLVLEACGLEFAQPHALLSTCVVFHVVARSLCFSSAACIHVISCAVWHAACVFHRLRAFMLSCLVWTRGLWVFSLAACSCPVLHMAGDLFAGHVLVFLFCVST